MYGKCTTHLIRLCGVIHTLNKAIRLIRDFPDASNNAEITNRFKADLVASQGTFHSNRIITIENVNHAESLLNYFNFNRVILANYKLEKVEITGRNLLHEIVCFIKTKKSLLGRKLSSKYLLTFCSSLIYQANNI